MPRPYSGTATDRPGTTRTILSPISKDVWQQLLETSLEMSKLVNTPVTRILELHKLIIRPRRNRELI